MPRSRLLPLAALLTGLPFATIAQNVPLPNLTQTGPGIPGLNLVQDGKEADRAALEQFLPEPLEGWTREIVSELDQTQVALLGDGYVASADYRGANGSFQIAMVVDAPMVMQMAPMFENTTMMAVIGQPTEIAGRDFVATDTQDIIGMLDGRILINASGNAVNGDSVIAHLETIDFDGLGAFNR